MSPVQAREVLSLESSVNNRYFYSLTFPVLFTISQGQSVEGLVGVVFKLVFTCLGSLERWKRDKGGGACIPLLPFS